VAVVSLFAMLGLAGNAIAARRNANGPRTRDAQSKVQKEKANPKGWIKTILDDLASKLSTPPG
jgi:hypothetical protein